MGNKLLLADDSITIQKVVGIIFANEDFELTIVDNGNAALEKAAAVKPDVMLIDALMPGKSGYEVCEAVRRDPALKATPILLLTGAFEPFDENKARQSGADDFISKPFESQQLIEKVKALMEVGRDRAAAPQATVAPSAAPAPSVAPPVAAPPPSAADIWGEAAVEPVVAFEPPAPVTPAPPVATESVDAFSFADVNVDEEPVIAEAAPPVVETATPVAEDDLWGAFELEEVATGEEAEFGTVVEVEEVAPTGVTEEFEPFAFEEVEEPRTQAAPAAPGQPEETVVWATEGEESFSFEEEPVAGVAPVAEAGAVAFEVEEPAPVVEPEPFASSGVSPFDIEFESETPAAVSAPVVQPPVAPVVEPPAPVAPAAVVAPVPPVPQAVAPAPAGEVTLSEEQLAQLVAKISRDLIEKIAWEVVPDLAETIIRDEIRKIKEGQ